MKYIKEKFTNYNIINRLENFNTVRSNNKIKFHKFYFACVITENNNWSTVRKYIRQLEERGLITTEPTEVLTKSSGRRNGNLLFTLRPIQEVIDQYYDCQLEELEMATERQRVTKLLRERESPA